MPSVKTKLGHVYRSDSATYRYHSPWVNSRTAKDAVQSMTLGRGKTYNNFHADDVAGAVDAIAAADPDALFSLGREASPVIYVQTYHPRAVIGVFSSMDDHRRPDELDKVTGGPRAASYLDRLPTRKSGSSVVRAWWD